MNPAQRFLAKLLGHTEPAMVIATCPKCGDQIQLASSSVGRQLMCPGCQKYFTVSEARPVVPRTSPRKSQLTDGRAIVTIGNCAGTSEAADHVEKLLASHGVQAFTNGSRPYAIQVPESDVEQARKVLLLDREKRRYRVVVHK